jgi:hypothetical protein
VVEDARRIGVRLTRPAGVGADDAVEAALEQPFTEMHDATLLGSFKEGDIALLKIAAKDCERFRLPTIARCGRDKSYSRSAAAKACTTPSAWS